MDEKIISAINHSGVPFQHFVEHELMNTPGIKILSREHSVQLPNQTDLRIDLLSGYFKVAKNDINAETILVFECKRAHPDYKSWVLTQSPVLKRNLGTFRVLYDHIKVLKQQERKIELSFENLTHIFHSAPFLADDVLEVKLSGNAIKGRKKVATDTVQSAVNQVYGGISGLIYATYQAVTNGREPYINSPLFIPIIVTSADLNKLEIEKDVNSVGELETGNTQLEKIGWCLYNAPISVSRQICRPLLKGVSFGLIDAKLSHRAIIIVNSGHINKFFEYFKIGFLH